MKRQLFYELRRYKKYFSSYTLLYLVLLFLVFVPSLIQNSDIEEYWWNREAGKTEIVLPGNSDTFNHYKLVADSLKRVEEYYRSAMQGQEETENNFVLPTASIRYEWWGKPASPGYRANLGARYFIMLHPYSMQTGYRVISVKDTNVLVHDAFAIKNKIEIGKPVYSKADTSEMLVNIVLSDKNVFIPITESGYNIIKVIATIIAVIVFICLLTIFLFMPINILMNISKGHAFIKQNVDYLNIMGWACIAGPLFEVLQQVILRLIFYKYFIPQLHFRYLEFYGDYHYFILAGIAILIIAKAFKKGHKLQMERDLGA